MPGISVHSSTSEEKRAQENPWHQPSKNKGTKHSDDDKNRGLKGVQD